MDKTQIIYTESGLCYDWKAIAANPHANHRPQIDLVAYKAQYINMSCLLLMAFIRQHRPTMQP